MSAPLIFNGRRAKMLTQDGILRADGSIIDNDGVPNLIKNGHAEINVTGWTVSKNTVAASRPDSGFVTSSTNITWTRNTTNPIDGQADFLYTKDAANRQGEQVYCGFTVAKKHRAKVLQIEIDYLVNSGTFSAGSSSTDSDIIVCIYDVTNSIFIEPSSFKFLSNSSTIADKFIANFQTSATGSSYRILFHQATTSSSAFAVQFKDVRVSPCQYVYGTPITDWVSYTPSNTQGLGTIASVNLKWRKVGDTMQIQGGFATGTVTGSTAQLGLPTGSTIGGTTSSRMYAGETIRNGGSRVTNFAIQGATYLTFGAGASSHGDVVGSSLFGSSEQLYITAFDIPIAGWSSSTQVSDGYDGRQIAAHAHKNASDQTGVNPNASFVKITFGSTSASGGGYDQTASFDTTNSKFTAPSSGKYSVKSNITLLATNILANEYGLVVYKNGSFYKVLDDRTQASTTVLNLQGSTTLDLVAGDYLELYLYGNGNNSASTLTIAGNVKNTWFAIEKLSSPQTMSATEVVAASYIVDGGGQSLTSTAVLQFNTKVFDTHNAVTTGSGWKFTAPYQGIYRLSYKMMQVNNTGSSCQIAMRKNASAIYRSQPAAIVNGPSTVVSNQMMQADSVLFSLNSGDYIDVYINSAAASGSVYTATTDSWINIERIK